MSLLRQVAKAVFATADAFMPTPHGPRLLIYHQVGAGTGRQMDLSTEDFVWQLDWLAANREIVDLETAVRRWNEPGADRLVVLTFDDGYEDTYTTAFPLLWERKLPFMLYVATQLLEAGCRAGVATLTWRQIKEMLDSGLLTLGAHTHTHSDLRFASDQETLEEVERCNSTISRRVGVSPKHFAYPWGYWSPAAHRIVTQTYSTAVLGAPRWPADFDPHRIHRFPVQHSDGTRWFRSRIDTGLLTEEWVRRGLRRYYGP